jgi:para-nitrobenzyl esterase
MPYEAAEAQVRHGAPPGGTGTATSGGPVVSTTEGALRGMTSGSVHIYKGIHYGESTAGANRFRPPLPVAPWRGIRDASVLGDQCYQRRGLPAALSEEGPGSEDCLVLNIWSPAGADSLPVMVFLHGGGFREGSGGAPAYDGGRLAERAGVVTVTVNHRLHILGFLHLADLAAGYEDCSNAGLQDLVEALRWIRRNIAAFGGDPGNVTLYGESGGAGKVSLLMAMPSAVGLFHKAIVQSGSQRRIRSREDATADAQAALGFLGLAPGDRTALEAVPLTTLYDACLRATAARVAARTMSRQVFAPVIDPHTMPWHPADPAALALSADVPLIIGSNEEETAWWLRDTPVLLDPPASDADIISTLQRVFPQASRAEIEKLPALLAAYRVRIRKPDLWRLLIGITSDLWMARDAIATAEARADSGCAPVYLYRFGWSEPCFGGSYAVHAAELLFIHDKLDLVGVWNTGTEPELRAAGDPAGDRHRLRDAMTEAWANFARSGKPSSFHLPGWPAYTREGRQTIRLDGQSTLLADPFGPELRELFAQLDLGAGS